MKTKDYSKTWTSAAFAIHEAIKFTKRKNLSLSEVMGYSSHAFRINIHKESVHSDGPTTYNAGAVQKRALLNMGIKSRDLAYINPASQEELNNLLSLAKESIDKGIPALGWDLFAPEFGVIYDYNDKKETLYAKDIFQDAIIPYDKFGEIKTGIHWVASIEDIENISEKQMFLAALEMILEHTFSKENYPFQSMFEDYQYGLEGYEAWISAFEKGSVDLEGNYYNIEVITCAREHAVQFLKETNLKWCKNSNRETSIGKLLQEAADFYEKVAVQMDFMKQLFSFSNGSTPNSKTYAIQAIQHLKKAKEFEFQGANVLKHVYKNLKEQS